MTFSPEEAPVTKTELNDMVRTFTERSSARFSPERVAEIAVAVLGPLIRESMELFSEIDGALIAGRAHPGDRVQGGEIVAVQERAMLAQERLARLPPKAVAMARGFMTVTERKTCAYIEGLMDGLHGELLRSRTGLSDKKLAELRVWLLDFTKRRIGPLTRM